MPNLRIKPGESVEKVTEKTTVIKKPDGSKRIVASVAPVNFASGGEMRPIDTTPVSDDGVLWSTKSTPYTVSWNSEDMSLSYQSPSGGSVAVRLVALDGKPFKGKKARAEVIGRRIKSFANNDLQIHLAVRPKSVEIFKVLLNDKAPKSMTWEITESGSVNVDPLGTTGFDNVGWIGPRPGVGRQRRVEILHDKSAVEQLQDGVRYTVTETVTGRTRFVDPGTMARSWVDEIIYPVEVDVTVTENIGANLDDGRGYTTPLWDGNGAPALDTRAPAWRFQTVDVPQGATINSAILTVNVTSRFGSGGSATLSGEDVDDAGAWAQYAATVPFNMTATTANVTYNTPGTTGIKTIDVTAIVQEIVNRAGWANNNDLRLGFTSVSMGGNEVVFEAYESAGTDEAQLDIDYTAGGASGQPTMARWNGIPGMSQTNSIGRGW